MESDLTSSPPSSSINQQQVDVPVDSSQEEYVFVDLESEESSQFVPNKLQSILTLEWLSEHYEPVEGVSLPRCLIYKHFLEFCYKNQFCPVNAASFGKVIRQVFPELRTRRLGTRGQSKYHYYGIRVKASSPYFGVFMQSQRFTAAPFVYGQAGGASSQQALWDPQFVDQFNNPTPMSTTVPSLLPEFPSAATTQPWEGVTLEQVDDLLATYRCHCRQIIDSILRGKLDEVPPLVATFWQALPTSTLTTLHCGTDKLADVIALCDNILYKTVVNVLIPGTVQQLHASLLHAIRHFSCDFQKVVEEGSPDLRQLPYLHSQQIETAKRLCQLLKRKTSLSHLAQATRAVLRTKVTVTQMYHDWRKRTEQNTVCSQLMWTAPGRSAAIKAVVKKCFCEFSRLLEKHASIEEHIQWLHTVHTNCMQSAVGAVGAVDDSSVKDEAERDFLLQWSYVCNLLIRDQTLRSATSFGSFHLLHLLFEEYLLNKMDVGRNRKLERAQWKKLFGNDAEVPGYFLTSFGVSDYDETRGLADAPLVLAEPLYHQLSGGSGGVMVQPCRQSVRGCQTSDGPAGGDQFVLQQPSPSSGFYIKSVATTSEPSLALARGPVPILTSGPTTAPILYQHQSSPVTGPPLGPPGNAAAVWSSSANLDITGWQMHHHQLASSSPPILPPSPRLRYSSSKIRPQDPGGCSSSWPSLEAQCLADADASPGRTSVSKMRYPSSPVAISSTFASPSGIGRQKRRPHQPTVIITQASNKPPGGGAMPPLQPIGSSSGVIQPSVSRILPKLCPIEKVQSQKVLATKIIKAIPLSNGDQPLLSTDEAKQKAVCFQFSITTNQKLNLTKGQILTTVNGDRYLINDVHTSVLEDATSTSASVGKEAAQ